MTERIIVWADIKCPWCWIGHRRLGAALAASARTITAEYRSYLLEPGGPLHAGLTVRQAALTVWGMSNTEWAQKRERIECAAQRQKLPIQIDTALVIDSRPAHRLLKLAVEHGADAYTVWDLAYRAHFADNANLEDPADLHHLGQRLGLAADAVQRMLDDNEYASAVVTDHRAARALGIRSVPAVAHGTDILDGAGALGKIRMQAATGGPGVAA